MQWPRTIDLGGGPSHNPETVNEGLCREAAQFLEEFVADVTSGGRSLGHGSAGRGEDGGGGGGAGRGGHGAAEGGGEHVDVGVGEDE